MQTRKLTSGDLPDLMRLIVAAGWKQSEQDWLRLLELAPEHCLGIEIDGAIVSTATAYCYGRDLAWIGMVLTHPDFRGQGLARRLMTELVAALDGRGIRWQRLDATDFGRHLYASLGYEVEYAVERWLRDAALPSPAAVSIPRPATPADYAFDTGAFGLSRAELLDSLWQSGSVAAIPGIAHASGREGLDCLYFGPCASRTPEAARELLDWFLARHPGQPIVWDLIPDNTAALALARELGFQCSRRLIRMRRPGPQPGPPIPERISEIYALAGFQFG
ncbi:MAG: GNAT family N-acetyltransferase [Bryobacteraceae bacterium]